MWRTGISEKMHLSFQERTNLSTKLVSDIKGVSKHV